MAQPTPPRLSSPIDRRSNPAATQPNLGVEVVRRTAIMADNLTDQKVHLQFSAQKRRLGPCLARTAR
jgi:hypothetical protein